MFIKIPSLNISPKVSFIFILSEDGLPNRSPSLLLSLE